MSWHFTVRAPVRGASGSRAHRPAGLNLFRRPDIWAWAVTIAALALLSLASPALAQDLRYEPINPSFGGNPLNSSHLQGVASSQNKYKDPTAVNSQDPAQQFVRALQSRLLSGLASQVSDAIFGNNPQDSGTITFGTQTIDFFRGIDDVQLTITDTALGTVTNISIPILQSPT